VLIENIREQVFHF